MNPVSIKLATFAAAILGVMGLFSVVSDLVLRKRARIRDRMREEFGGGATAARKSELFRNLGSLQENAARGGPAAWKDVRTLVAQSGLEIEPSRLLQLALTAAIVGGILGVTLTGLWSLGGVAAFAGLLAPFLYVQAARKARIRALCLQLPDAFDLMSRAVRAGQTMPGAMNLAAAQLKPPIAAEFAACCEQQNFGLPQEVALQELARRSGVMELQMFCVAMLVHRNTGGNLVEILENLSDVIRKRVRLVGKVRAATSEGRLQAVVLSILPLVTFAALLAINRPYAQILLDHPYLLCGVLISEGIGALWIRRIVTFQY